MKRWCIVGLCLAMLLCLTACGGDEGTGSGTGTGDGYRLGLATVSKMNVAGGDLSSVKATVAAVTLDKEGVIRQCRIEETAFDVTLKNGALQSMMDTMMMGKWERGDDYTLTDEERGDSSNRRSWREQVDAFCRYVVGKTPDEVSSIAATDGRSSEIPGCDLVITDFIQAVHKAGKSVKNAGMMASDTLHLAVSADRSKDSADEAPQFDIEMAAVTVGKDGKITACVSDTLQAKLTVKEGVFSMASGDLTTKRMMGDSYGMKDASSLKKEWYQQADAFDAYVVGKTPDTLQGVSVDKDGRVDGISGCTIVVSGMLKNVIKAAKMTGTGASDGTADGSTTGTNAGDTLKDDVSDMVSDMTEDTTKK